MLLFFNRKLRQLCVPWNKGDIKLLHKLLRCYKTTSFQFLTLNTVSKYALLVQPINFQGYFESEEKKNQKTKKKVLLMRKKPHINKEGIFFLTHLDIITDTTQKVK